jgi:hypothetical protein
MTRFTRCVFAFAIVVDLVAAAINGSQGRGWLAAFHLGLVVGLVWMWVRTERSIRRSRAAATWILDSMEAPRPEGVKVLRADGTVLPCELVYRGREEDGQHLWEVAGMVLQPGDELYADVMPGHTGISIGFKEEW